MSEERRVHSPQSSGRPRFSASEERILGDVFDEIDDVASMQREDENTEFPQDRPEKRSYGDAREEIPMPPKRNKKDRKERGKLSSEDTLQVEDWQRGSALSSSDRAEFLKSLSAPATDLAVPATLDDDLKGVLGNKCIYRASTNISERDFYAMHELTAHAINQVAFTRKLLREGDRDSLEKADDYLLVVGDLLSICVRDLVGHRRQIALGALGLQPEHMPSLKTLPLDGSARLDTKSDDFVPNLFGGPLKEEIMSTDSAVKKSIEKLRKERQPLRSSFAREATRRVFTRAPAPGRPVAMQRTPDSRDWELSCPLCIQKVSSAPCSGSKEGGHDKTYFEFKEVKPILKYSTQCATMGELLKEIRNQRAYTIQNDVQYLYIHRVMICYFLDKHRARYESIMNADNQAKYKKFVDDYNAATGQG